MFLLMISDMDIFFFTEAELSSDPRIWDGCLSIAKEAVEEGAIASLMFSGDAGDYIAMEDGQVIGYLSVSAIPDDRIPDLWEEGRSVFVEQVVVSRQWRNCHIMSRMYARLFSDMPGASVFCAIHAGNSASYAAHCAIGFHEAGVDGDYRMMMFS